MTMIASAPTSDALSAAAAAQATDHEAYRQTPYPAALHIQAVPDRLAVIARLAGMSPAPIETARMLDIGTGNGLHLLALATAYPRASFLGLDVVEDGIAQGREWAAKVGLGNVELRVGDLLDLSAVEGEYDYITAHGVFAWVPPPVAQALLALIGRHLAPQGVAMVSYNALPGSFLKLAMRDRMLAAAGDEADPATRIALGRHALETIAADRPGDTQAKAGFRARARDTLESDDEVLLHDEMGGNFYPRYRTDVIREAATHGLRYLGDAHHGSLPDGFLRRGDDPDRDQDAQVLANAGERDWIDLHFFHNTLFVRADAEPRRTLDLDVLASLYATCHAHEVEPGEFVAKRDGARIENEVLLGALRRLIEAAPHRLRLGDLGLEPIHLSAMFGLFNTGVVTLHDGPEPFAVEPGDRPVTSPLARMMIEEGMPWTATLDHKSIDFEPAAQAMLLALDGSGDQERLAAAAREAGFSTPESLSIGIAKLGRQGVFVA